MSDSQHYDDALSVLITVNRTIGASPTLTNEERKTLHILGRVQTYLLTRRDRGDEIFQSELRDAGKSTREFGGES